MIERLYFKNFITFDEVELEFDKGLIVLSGPSGAGKSVLISTILASFGYNSLDVSPLSELQLEKPSLLKNELYDFEALMTIKMIKKEKLRYFIDGQNISKKSLKDIFSPYVKYLSIRDKGGFESSDLLELIDRQLQEKDKGFKKLQKEYKKRYENYKEKQFILQKIVEDEKRLVEIIDYAKYEIERISTINPVVGEEETLLKIKQQLSRIDKIDDALLKAMQIFSLEASVEEVYRLLDKDSTFFSEMMNTLRGDFEESQNLSKELEEFDVEEVLNRLGDLTFLKNRYGSIEEALAYKTAKEKEILGYDTLSKDKHFLENFLDLEYSELMILAKKISHYRQIESRFVEELLKEGLTILKLPSLVFEFRETTLFVEGIDKVDISLDGSKITTLSGGEYNRLRLALISILLPQKKESQGVVILDEIDANVSGDESIAIADMIQKISTVYQVFAISHQPHLSAKANQHILVTKKDKMSEVKVLNTKEERVSEISRIIAGESPTTQAIAFAKKLMD